MRTSLVIALSLLLGANAPLLAAPSVPGVPTVEECRGHQHSGTTTVLEQSAGRVVVQVSTYEAVELLSEQRAVQYVSRLSEEKLGRIFPVNSQLAQYGYERTDQMVVLRSLSYDTASGRWVPYDDAVRPVPAATYSNSSGEAIFVSWDDGDDTTWEGTTYTERYSDGSWASWESQANIAASTGYTIWETLVGSGGGSGGGGGGGGGGDPLIRTTPQEPSAPVQIASTDPSYAAGLMSHGGGVALAQGPSWGGFLACSLVNCYGCYKVCRLVGPAFFWCMDPCCMTMMLSCILLQLI